MDDRILPQNGLKTAVAGVHDPAAALPDGMDGEQLALLPLRNAHDALDRREEQDPVGRGRGRPAGSRNKSTQEWTRFILSRYPSPLMFLAEMYSRPLPELAAELLEYSGASAPGVMTKPTYAQVVELLKIQLGAAKELAPYLHGKQPLEIQAGDKGMINLFIGDTFQGQVGAAEATNFDLNIMEIENELNQGLSADEKQEFDAQEFDVSPESGEGQEFNNKKHAD